jgi:1,4-alpha-glucan branching enzyme
MKKIIFTCLFFLAFKISYAQILTWNPYFVTVNDTIEIIYDASKGNGALVGVNPIYAHTGVITASSAAPSDWKYVKTSWGQNTPETQLTPIGGSLYKIKYHIKSYYGLPDNEVVKKLAFVFRNSSGSIVGRDTDGSDIFLPVTQPGLNLSIVTSFTTPYFPALNDTVKGVVNASGGQNISLYKDNALIAQTSGGALTFAIAANEYGKKRIKAVVTDAAGLTKADSFYYVVNKPTVWSSLPAGIKDGINYTSSTGATLCFYAPNKNPVSDFVYVIGDFNNWEADPEYMMNKTNDNSRFWVNINNLTPGKEYRYQFLISGNMRVADYYAQKVLDPANDKYIDTVTYPGLLKYPEDKTTQIVSVLQTDEPQYVWQTQNYKKPDKSKLVIYELLVRDFLAEHNYKTLIDTLSYLKNLGVNAIELMPVNEFEGNESWGYNPSFYFAPDKYYGTKNDLKKFIDKAHGLGMAVILDMVLNHSFGSSPMVRMYFDAVNNMPAANNPWFNQTATHPYSVGYDFNHESQATKDFVDRVTTFWLSEYKVDGYRFDLAKGFTQTNSGSDVNKWGQYDQSRINIWKRISDVIRKTDSTAYLILEHFADNSEEKVLSDYGFMLWGNLNYNYNESTMGYFDSNKSDISWGSYKARGWSAPNLVTYMESHDEERLMFKNLQYGNSNGAYNIKDLNTALNRIKLAAAFFFTIPGPKMLWQFGELGYDVSIENPCRVCNKPILWNYNSDPERKKLYKTFAALIKLRTEYEAFSSSDYALDVTGQVKRINITHPSMNIVIIGNFDLNQRTVTPGFNAAGDWYDYFTGAKITVADLQAAMPLNAGEFHIYTTAKLPIPEPGIISGVEDSYVTAPGSYSLSQNYPNPFNPSTTISYSIPKNSFVTLKVYDILGREAAVLVNEEKPAGKYSVVFNAVNGGGKKLSSGVYLYKIQADGFSESRKFILMK